MPDDKSEPTKSASNSLINIDTTILSLLYQDLAQPGVQQIGKALGTTLGLATSFMLPWYVKNESAKLHAEHQLEKLREKLKNIKDEDVAPIPPELGVSVVDRLTKTTNDRLSELYIQLLTTAAHINTAGLAHPRFVLVIESITPDEAKILEYFEEAKWRIPFISAWAQEYREDDSSPTGKQIQTILTRRTQLERSSLLSIPDNAPLYFNNLVALGLVHVEDSRMVADSVAYDAMEESFREQIQTNASYFSFKHNLPVAQVVTHFGYYELTELGISFLKSCHPGREHYYHQP